MKSYFIAFIIVVSSASTQAAQPTAGWDAKADVSAQTYPLGGTATASAGFGHELWRDSSKENEPRFWQYGYLRPNVEWKSALFINRITAALELYPVSILGLSAGAGVDARNFNKFTDFDCVNLLCEQSLAFQFAQARLIGGFGKFVGMVIARYDWYRAESGTKPFYDEMSYLVGRSGSDDLRTLNLVALYRQDETWGYGALGIYQQFIYSASNSSSVFAIGTYTDGPWRATFGLGEFHSSHQAQRPAAIVSLTYLFGDSIGLMD